jgi:hypothetical protein
MSHDEEGSFDSHNEQWSRSNSENRSWQEYRRLVLHEIKRHEDTLSDHDARITKNNTDITVLKTQAAVWGAISGLIAGLVTTVIGGLILWAITGSSGG